MKLKGKRSDHFPDDNRRRETTRDERLRIITLRDDAKMSFREIGRITGIDFRTCHRIYERAKATGSPSNRKRPGRPVLFTEAEKERLRRFVTRDARTRRMTWEEIIQEMGYDCSVRTIRDAMASMDYHKRLPKKKFGVGEYNKAKRVEWCRERLHWTYDDWLRTVWTDFTTFTTFNFGDHRPWVIRRPTEEYHPDCVDDRETRKSGPKNVTVWAAFCGTLKSELLFLPTGTPVSPATYTNDVLDPLLIPFWHKTCEKHGWIRVVEDGAAAHAGVSKRCREINEVETLELAPQSPDLNLIEALWGDMEAELGEAFGRVSEPENLKIVLKNAWDRIGAYRLDGLIRSMPERLEAVIAAGGDATPY